MPDTPTEKCKFKSNFGGGYIAAGSFIAESIIARKARKEGTELPFKFWNNEKWKRDFLLQLRFANSLLKIYDYEAIIKALRTEKGKKVYSLGAKFILDHLIKNEQEKIDRLKLLQESKEPEPVKEETSEIEYSPRESFPANTDNMINKLRDL